MTAISPLEQSQSAEAGPSGNRPPSVATAPAEDQIHPPPPSPPIKTEGDDVEIAPATQPLPAVEDRQDEAKPELNEEHARLLASLAAGHGIDLSAPDIQSAVTNGAIDGIQDVPMLDVEPFGGDGQNPFYSDGESHGDDDEDDDDEDEFEDDMEPQGPIQAYAKIDFPGFSIYLKKLEVTIGRRPAHLARAQKLVLPLDGSSSAEGDVDIDLGRVKAISRLHAIIYYHAGPFYPQPYPDGAPDASYSRGMNYSSFWREPGQQLRDLFVIKILGRHGAMIDDVYIRQGGVVQLGKR